MLFNTWEVQSWDTLGPTPVDKGLVILVDSGAGW
jgi:hypothetical protein